MATNGVDTPITPESNPISEQLAQATAATGEAVILPLPGTGQTETIIPDLGVTYRIGAADARFEQDQGNLVVKTGQGTVILQDFFVLAETDLPPSLQLGDGQVESPEAIIAQIANFDPEAVAPAAGGGGGGDGGGSGFTPYSISAIGEGLSTLDLLGNLDLTFGLPEGIDEVGVTGDPAEGALNVSVISVTTEVTPDPEVPLQSPVTGSFNGGFEDWMPNADEEDYTVAPMRMVIDFSPVDNEVLEGIQVFPTGDFSEWQFLINGVPQVPAPNGAYVVLAADLDNITLLPPEDFDGDMPFTVNALITDPDTGDSATISLTTVAVLDAVADMPSITIGDGGGTGGGGSAVLIPNSEETPFTMASPTGYELPSEVTLAGGIVIDMVGINGVRVVGQLAASGLFSGYTPDPIPPEDGAETSIGTFNDLSSAIAALGGGLASFAVRMTIWDGDTVAGNFDDGDVTLLANGTDIGNWSSAQAIETNSSGAAIGTVKSGFENNSLDTGWFSTTDSVALQAIHDSIDGSGSLEISLYDIDTGDNYLDFTQGLDGDLVDVGSGVIVGGHVFTEDNATEDDGEWTDGTPAFNIGFTTETPDQDGSEELTQVVVALEGLQVPLSGDSSGTGILWNGIVVYEGDTIQIPAKVFDPANPGTPMYILVEATATFGTDTVTFDNFTYIGSGEPVPFQVLALDFTGVAWDVPSPEPAITAYASTLATTGTGLQVLLPQHSDDDFTVHVAVTSSETNLSGGELSLDNNNAVKTTEFDVEVQAVADKPILSLQNIEVDEDEETYTPPAPLAAASIVLQSEPTAYQLISAPVIGVTFPDQDGSESHTVFLSLEATPGVPCDQEPPRLEALSSLPSGFQVAYDTGDGLTIVDPETDGSYAIPEAYLDAVKIIAPKDWYGTIDVEVRAVATEDNPEGDVALLTAEAVGSFTITVDATPDIFGTAEATATESLVDYPTIIAQTSGDINFEIGDDCPPDFALTGIVTTGLTSRGNPIDTIDIAPDGHTLSGYVGTTLVFTLTVTQFGHYEYTEYEPLDHGEGTATDDTLPIDFSFTLTDQDGDSADGTLRINVNDDEPGVPDVSGNAGIVEDTLLTTTGTVDAYIGADSDGGVRFVAGQSAPVGLKSGTDPILYQVSDDQIIGYTSDPSDPVFVLTLVAGTYEFELFQPLFHDHDSVEDLEMTLDFDLETIDGDGDVAGPSTLSVTITDDDIAANDADVSEQIEPGQTATFVLGDLFDDYHSMDGVDVAVDGDGASYDPSTGEISFSSATEGEHEFTVTLTDGDGDTATKTITVVVGGVPQAYDNYLIFDEAELPTTNILLIFDRSGSMGDDGNLNLDAAKAAVMALVNAYDDLGGFNLKLVTFASDGTAVPGWFTDPADVQAYLDTITANGTTHYDDALAEAAASWTDVPTDNVGDTVAYFLSDGIPNGGYLDSGEIADWEAFLDDNGFSEAYAIGMGAGAPGDEDLQDVAWSSDGSEGEIFIVTDLDLLTATVLSTLPDYDGNVITDPAEAGPDIGMIDDSGSDGWPATDTIISIEYNGTVYTDDDSDGDIEITLTDDHGTVVFDTDNGDYTFTPGSGIDVAEDIVHLMTYTVQDSSGSESSAVFHLSLKDAGDPTAYDNANAAMMEEVFVPTSVVAVTLADFNDEDCTPDGGTYNPWIFDTSGDLPTPSNLTGNLKSVLSGTDAFEADGTIIAPDNMWGRSSSDARVSFNTLRLEDNDNGAATVTKVVTPTFTVESPSTTIVSFNLAVTNDEFTTGDVFTWKVLKWDGSDWVEVQSGTHTTAADPAISTAALGAGIYRLYFEADDKTPTPGSRDFDVRIDNIRMTTTTPAYSYYQGIPLAGNVIADPNTLVSSSDPWNAVDDEGTEGASLTAVVFNGTEYGVTVGGTDIVGLYGTLHIEPNGDYTYTAFGEVANVGQSDTFTYFLTQDDGDTDAADLVITIADESYVPPTPISGDGGNNILDGTVGDDVILGGEGNDTLNGDDGNDHLEGEAGNDELHGGAGNDVLLGGEGTDSLFGEADDDVLVGGEGDDQLTGGDGADTFLYTSTEDGHDAILDFDIAEDTIDLDAVFDALGADADLEVTGSDQDYTVTVSLDGVSQLDIDVHTTDITDITALTAKIVTDEPG